MAMRSIAAKKLRAFLTMLGVIIGITAVMIITTRKMTEDREALERLKEMGNNTFQAYLYDWASAEDDNSFYEELLSFCRGMDDVIIGITPESSWYNSDEWALSYGVKSTSSWMGDQEKTIQITPASDTFTICRDYQIAAGRNMSRFDYDQSNPVCLIGSRTAELFFDKVSPVGKKMTINGYGGAQEFEIIGVFASKKTRYSTTDEVDRVLVIPYTTLPLLSPWEGKKVENVTIKARDLQDIPAAMTRVQAFFNAYTRSNPSAYAGTNSNATQIIDTDEEQAKSLRSTVAIAAISLIVGGIGIMNIMLVSVTERTREIGIRRAIGAERSSIIGQFLVEASVLCGIGGLIGIALGYAVMAAMGHLEGKSYLPDTRISLAAFMVSLLMGVICGLQPAIKAANMQPVDALRSD